jgi:hypothetical protein
MQLDDQVCTFPGLKVPCDMLLPCMQDLLVLSRSGLVVARWLGTGCDLAVCLACVLGSWEWLARALSERLP